jgi:hypothetical protein
MTFKQRPGARARLVDALGFGLLNLGFAIETAAKGHTPVRGGFRSFAPDGSDRRHAAALRAHDRLRRSTRDRHHLDADAERQQLPDYVPAQGAVVFVGTNSGYGRWVDQGTSKMPPRPFLEEGLADVKPRLPELVSAGARARLGQ